MTNRIIIGETERSGLPISAPLGESGGQHEGKIRWLKRDGVFVLQQFRGWAWEDVGCQEIEEEEGK